jgi:hypothetical protein
MINNTRSFIAPVAGHGVYMPLAILKPTEIERVNMQQIYPKASNKSMTKRHLILA